MNKRVLLIGMPNVGKSVIFNKLTGINTGIANYAGTTVEYTKGKMRSAEITIIDAPGTYTLDATNEAEKVAIELLESKPDAVVCVLDANCLESSVHLMLQVIERKLPVIGVLNRVDIIDSSLCPNIKPEKRNRYRKRCRKGKRRDTENSNFRHHQACIYDHIDENNLIASPPIKAAKIDLDVLREELGTGIIPMIATKGIGMNELSSSIKKILTGRNHSISLNTRCANASWDEAERITQKALHKIGKESKKTKLEDLIVKPFPGIFIAMLALIVTFGIVIGLGMSARRFILLPFFRDLVFPLIISGVELFFSEGFMRNVLIGEYGFLIKGIEWPITLVLPYVVSFYLALSLLEDSGYLPRLGILLDGILNKIGLSGANIIPLILGYGCTIPAIASTRAMNSRKERLIVVSMVTLSVPCVSQTGVFITLLAERSVFIVLGLFLLSFTAAAIAGYVSNLVLKGSRRPITLVEVPVLLPPDLSILGKKIWVRIKSFLTGGAVLMFYAIFFTAILYEAGVFEVVGRLLAPIVENWLRLPREASVPLILGVIRRELTVLPLMDMDLTSLQLFVGSVVGLFYVPCIAVLVMIMKEFGLKIAVLIFVITMSSAFLIGGVIAALGGLIF